MLAWCCTARPAFSYTYLRRLRARRQPVVGRGPKRARDGAGRRLAPRRLPHRLRRLIASIRLCLIGRQRSRDGGESWDAPAPSPGAPGCAYRTSSARGRPSSCRAGAALRRHQRRRPVGVVGGDGAAWERHAISAAHNARRRHAEFDPTRVNATMPDAGSTVACEPRRPRRQHAVIGYDMTSVHCENHTGFAMRTSLPKFLTSRRHITKSARPRGVGRRCTEAPPPPIPTPSSHSATAGPRLRGGGARGRRGRSTVEPGCERTRAHRDTTTRRRRRCPARRAAGGSRRLALDELEAVAAADRRGGGATGHRVGRRRASAFHMLRRERRAA